MRLVAIPDRPGGPGGHHTPPPQAQRHRDQLQQRRLRPGRRLDDVPVRLQAAKEAGEQPLRRDPQEGGKVPLEVRLADLPALDPLVERTAGRVPGGELAEPTAGNPRRWR